MAEHNLVLGGPAVETDETYFGPRLRQSQPYRTIVHKEAHAIGDVYTKKIENAYSLFKSGLYGAFGHVSKAS